MTKGSNGTSPSVTLLDELKGMIGNVLPADTTSPPGAPRRGSRPSLGVADAYTQQVFFAHAKLADELKPHMVEAATLTETLMDPLRRASGGGDKLRALDELTQFGSDENRRKIARVKELNQLIESKKPVVDLLNRLFWAEAQRRNPATLNFAKLTLCEDWHFVEGNDNDEFLGDFNVIGDLLGGFGRGEGVGRGAARSRR